MLAGQAVEGMGRTVIEREQMLPVRVHAHKYLAQTQGVVTVCSCAYWPCEGLQGKTVCQQKQPLILVTALLAQQRTSVTGIMMITE
jgi:hypothetical protein